MDATLRPSQEPTPAAPTRVSEPESTTSTAVRRRRGGAGIAGLHALHRLRGLGLSVRLYEAGAGVGGVSRGQRPGKPRAFMPYPGGLRVYRRKCPEVASKGY